MSEAEKNGDKDSKLGVGHRARKHLASKIAGSKTGRNIIVMFLGERGPEIISALKHSVARHKGDEQVGKDLKENIYKFALKAKIMGDEGQFDLKLVNEYSEPMLVWLRQMARGLRFGENFSESGDEKAQGANATAAHRRSHVRPHAGNNDTPPNIPELVEQYKLVAKHVQELMNPHMTEKNQELLKFTCDIVGTEEFLKDLMEAAEYKEDKKTVARHLHSLMLYGDEKYSLEMHNVIVSQSQFGDQYSAVIRTVREFWSHVEDKNDDKVEVGLSIFNKLVEQHHEYYNTLEKCKYGENPMEQYTHFLDAISIAFKLLDDWPKLCEKLSAIGKSHEEWAPGFPIEAYDHMLQAMHTGCKDYFGAVYTRRVHKSMDVILRLMIAVMKEEFTK